MQRKSDEGMKTATINLTPDLKPLPTLSVEGSATPHHGDRFYSIDHLGIAQKAVKSIHHRIAYWIKAKMLDRESDF